MFQNILKYAFLFLNTLLMEFALGLKRILVGTNPVMLFFWDICLTKLQCFNLGTVYGLKIVEWFPDWWGTIPLGSGPTINPVEPVLAVDGSANNPCTIHRWFVLFSNSILLFHESCITCVQDFGPEAAIIKRAAYSRMAYSLLWHELYKIIIAFTQALLIDLGQKNVRLSFHM